MKSHNASSRVPFICSQMIMSRHVLFNSGMNTAVLGTRTQWGDWTVDSGKCVFRLNLSKCRIQTLDKTSVHITNTHTQTHTHRVKGVARSD